MKEQDHSIFTYYLLKGLKGNEDSVDVYGNVTADSLGKYVFREIVNLPAEKRPKQKPITKTEVAGEVVVAHYPEFARPGISQKDQDSIIIEEGNNYFSTGKYNEAIRCYDKALELNPKNAVAYRQKEDLHYKKISKSKLAVSLIIIVIGMTFFIPLPYSLFFIGGSFFGWNCYVTNNGRKCYKMAKKLEKS